MRDAEAAGLRPPPPNTPLVKSEAESPSRSHLLELIDRHLLEPGSRIDESKGRASMRARATYIDPCSNR
jgi:hypothetical protein